MTMEKQLVDKEPEFTSSNLPLRRLYSSMRKDMDKFSVSQDDNLLAWDDWKKNICVWFMNVVSLVEYGYLKNDEDNGFVIVDIPTASASLPQSLLLPATKECCVCGSNSTLRCGKCKVVAYCSMRCQRMDWKKGIRCGSAEKPDEKKPDEKKPDEPPSADAPADKMPNEPTLSADAPADKMPDEPTPLLMPLLSSVGYDG
jgi:hypothetical protein